MKNNTDLLATWKLLLSLELIWREYVSKGIDLVRMNHGDFHQIPYSGKFSLEANFRDFCRRASAKIKTAKSTPRWKLMKSLHAYVDTN